MAATTVEQVEDNHTDYRPPPRRSFIWKIPTISAERENLTCQAYLRQTSNHFIPEPICRLVMQYHSHDLISLNDIMNTETLNPPARFTSPVFTIQGLRWHLELWPSWVTVCSIFPQNIMCHFMTSLRAHNISWIQPEIPRPNLIVSEPAFNAQSQWFRGFFVYFASRWNVHCPYKRGRIFPKRRPW